MSFGRAELVQVGEVGVQVDLLDGPGVADRVAEPVVERGIAHRTQGQAHAGVEQQLGTDLGGGHWQASQVSEFSREQVTASAFADVTVACWIRVAGRERR